MIYNFPIYRIGRAISALQLIRVGARSHNPIWNVGCLVLPYISIYSYLTDNFDYDYLWINLICCSYIKTFLFFFLGIFTKRALVLAFLSANATVFNSHVIHNKIELSILLSKIALIYSIRYYFWKRNIISVPMTFLFHHYIARYLMILSATA